MEEVDRGGEGGERPRLHLRAARRLRDVPRRARREDLRRRAPAHRGGPRVPPRRPDPDPRRAHLLDRLAHRGRDPRRPRPADGGPDDDPDRPPALDHPQRRRDRCHGPRRDRPAAAPTTSYRDQPGLYRQLREAQTRAQRRQVTAASRRLPPPSEPDGADGADGRGRRTAGPAGAERRPASFGEARIRVIRREAIAAVPLPRPKIVLLGMLTKIPVGGVGWLVGHYATGSSGWVTRSITSRRTREHRRCSCATRATTAPARRPRTSPRSPQRFGLEDRWAFQALHENGRCYGMSAEQLDRLYRDAALIINMHGGTLPLPEHAATDRLVFLGTDPVEVEFEVERGDKHALEFLDQHVAHFTWGLNYGNPDCKLPWARPYCVRAVAASRRARLLGERRRPGRAPFTTIGNWRQHYRDVQLRGPRLPLEQAPAVHEDPRPADAGPRRRSSSPCRATTAATACCWRSTGGGCGPDSSSRATSTPTANTSSAPRERSRPPRSRTSISAPAGSASGASPTSRRDGR